MPDHPTHHLPPTTDTPQWDTDVPWPKQQPDTPLQQACDQRDAFAAAEMYALCERDRAEARLREAVADRNRLATAHLMLCVAYTADAARLTVPAIIGDQLAATVKCELCGAWVHAGYAAIVHADQHDQEGRP